jgi:type VII secretion-associated serine protease mycosin
MRPAGLTDGMRRRVGRWTAVPVLALLAVAALPAPVSAETVRGLSWHHTFLNTKTAHTISQGKDVVVAVVDSGVEATHPDLQGRVKTGKGYGSTVAVDGRRDSDASEGHGTIVAGTIAASGSFGANSALGIAPLADILPVAIPSGGTDQQTADGIRWAADQGVDVMNLSFAGSSASESIVEAVQYALSQDVVVVAGAGNVEETGEGVGWPASVPGVIAVTGTNRQGQLWPGSSRGPQAVLSAPAVQIIGPAPRSASTNNYLVADGTSFATAIVSGVAALVVSRYPALNAPSVVNRLIRTAKDRGAPGRDPDFGYGIVDPVSALTADVPEVAANPLVGPKPNPVSAPRHKGTDSDPAVQFSGPWAEHPWIVVGILVGAVALAIALVVLARRGRRRVPVVAGHVRASGWPPGTGPLPPAAGPPPYWSTGPPPPSSAPPYAPPAGAPQPYPPPADPLGALPPPSYPGGISPPSSSPPAGPQTGYPPVSYPPGWFPPPVAPPGGSAGRPADYPEPPQ